MILFYVKDLHNAHTLLEEDEYIHCCKVLRKKEGDVINITDGKGHSATAIILETKKQKAILEIQNTVSHSSKSSSVTIGIAPPKNRSRWEWFIEKSVEIGVDHIIPMRSKNSERVKFNIERSHKIIRSAALQSLRYFHPIISELTTIEAIVEANQDASLSKFAAHFNKDNIHLRDIQMKESQKLILIGPEGDFTKEELSMLASNNFKEVNISENRLRTETAGLVAVNLLV